MEEFKVQIKIIKANNIQLQYKVKRKKEHTEEIKVIENKIETAKRVISHIELKYNINEVKTEYKNRIAEKKLTKSIRGKLRTKLAYINKKIKLNKKQKINPNNKIQ